jgi:hypothetical protein
MGLLIAEERERGNWDYLAETLWANWPDLRLFVRNPADPTGTWENIAMETEAERDGFGDAVWRDSLGPLLESLIKANRVGDAETVVLDMANLPGLGDIRRMSAELAKACGRGELGDRWAAMKMPGRPGSGQDMDALEAELRARVAPAAHHGAPTILLASAGENADFAGMYSELRKVEPDWPLSVEALNPRLSELLFAREGWPKDGARWALIDADRAMLANGPGSPSAEDIRQALTMAGKEPPAKRLRRFISEHPRHMEAKESLLWELSRRAAWMAVDLEASRLSMDEKPPAEGTLTEEEDWAIWGEYATLYGQTLPLLLECAQPYGQGIPFSYLSLFSSKALNGVAHALLPQVEAQLELRPTDESLWNEWTSLSDASGQSRFKDLKNSIALSPLDDPLDLPPEGPRIVLSLRYMLKDNWQGLIDLHEWRWDAIVGKAEPGAMEEVASLARFLLAAYLNLGKDREADAVVEALRRTPSWGWLQDQVVDMAKRHGKDATAERWAKK